MEQQLNSHAERMEKIKILDIGKIFDKEEAVEAGERWARILIKTY